MSRQCAFLLVALLAAACGAPVPDTVGVTESALHPCPSTSNCVLSDGDGAEGIPSLRLRPGSSPAETWEGVIEVVSSMPRTRVLSQTTRYVHAEVTSRLFRFRDDLELLLNPETGVIQVRSASRIGRSDLGVNRERADRLIALLLTRGLIEEPRGP